MVNPLLAEDLRASPYFQGLKIRKHIKSRSLRLRIDPIHNIPVLTIPTKCNLSQINQFLRDSLGWLKLNLNLDLPKKSALPEQLHYKGELYTLSVVHHESNFKITDNSDDRILYIASNAIMQRIVLMRFLKENALKEAQQWVHHYALQLGVPVRQVGIKEYRSRWGCCYKRGDIYLSWRLIMAPPEIFQYVCAHETAHLIHQNHSLKFWQTVRQIYPDYKTSAKWLKVHGHQLFTIV